MIKSTKAFAAILLVAICGRYAAAVSVTDVGGQETCGSFSGDRASVATDSLNQPHIVLDATDVKVLYQYHKINDVWGGMEVARSSRGGAYDASRLYMPHVEIDAQNRMWVSCKFGTKEWGSMLGQGIWCYNSVHTTMNNRRFFKYVAHTVTHKGNGNVGLDPNRPNECVDMAAFGRYAILNDAGAITSTGTKNIGSTGEKFRFRISPRAGQNGVWHTAFSGWWSPNGNELNSDYYNSVINRRERWIANSFHFPDINEDVWHPSIGIDLENPLMCYIGERLPNGLRIQVWTGTRMLFNIANDSLLNLDPSAPMRPSRMGPQFAPAVGGGTFVTWSTSSRVKLAYIAADGIPSDPVPGGNGSYDLRDRSGNLVYGANPTICTDSVGNLHMCYQNGGQTRYRKLIVAELVLRAPEGTTEDATPTFSWDDYMQPPADDYKLLVEPGPVIDVVVSGSSNSYTSSTPLPVGEYTWWLERRQGGSGQWYGPLQFEVIPGQAVITYPTPGKKIYAFGALHFDWERAANANRYQVWINGEGGVFTNLWLEGANSTNWTPTDVTGWTAGVYTWWVRSAYKSGDTNVIRAWDAPQTFQLCPPPAPVPVSPANGDSVVYSDDLSFEWQQAGSAIGYEVWVGRSGAEMWSGVAGEVPVGAGNVVWQPEAGLAGAGEMPKQDNFDPATYEWWVRARNHFGVGVGSQVSTFIRTRVMSPNGGVQITESRPQFTWTPTRDATWYHIWLNRDNKTFHTEWIIAGAAGSGSWTPNFDMPAGSYTWWVKAWDAVAGDGPWMDAATFTIPERRPTEKATLLEPVLVAPSNMPVFVWTEVDKATTYRVWINKDDKKLHAQWVGNRTNFTMDTAIAPGDYTWWVQAGSPDGNGPWSDRADFSYGKSRPLVPVDGAALTDTRRPAFSWLLVPGSVRYRVWINLGNRKHHEHVTASGVEGSWTPPDDWPSGDYTWWVKSVDGAGAGVWSARSDFQITVGPPGRTVLVSPDGGVYAEGPISYVWQADPAATGYELWVSDSVDKWYGVETNTGMASGQITLDVPGHTAESYTWWVRALSPDGSGLWSQGKTFEVSN